MEQTKCHAQIEALLTTKGYEYIREQRGNVIWAHRNFTPRATAAAPGGSVKAQDVAASLGASGSAEQESGGPRPQIRSEKPGGVSMAEKCPLQTSLRALSAMRGRRDGVCARLLDRAAVPAALNTFRLDAAAIERTPDDVTGVHVPAMDPCAPFGELSRDLILYRHCSGLQKTRSACRPLEDASGRKIEVASNHELDQARADCKRRGLTPCAFHSQMHEDAVLFNMFFKNHRGGVYLEMGALDGRLFSNTLFFQQTLDWSGVLIEPGILLSGPCSSSSSFTLNQYV